MAGFVFFVSGLSLLLFMPFDDLGSSVGHVFKHHGQGVGRVLTVSSVWQDELNVGIRVH